MASNVEPWMVALGAVPGVMGLAGAAVSFWRTGVRYGTIVQRLLAVETDVEAMKDMAVTVARIDERTKATANDVSNLRQSVDRFVEALLQRGLGSNDAAPARSRAR